MSTKGRFGSRKGATFIEYALLAGLVAIVVAAAAMLFGDQLKELFTDTGKQAESVDKGVKSVKLTGSLEKAKEMTGGGETKKD